MTYLLRGVQVSGSPEKRIETPVLGGMLLPALGMHFPGRHDPEAPRRTVRYRLNRVAQGELFPNPDDDDDTPDPQDDDN